MQILRSFSAWHLILMGGLLIGIGACIDDNGVQAYDNNRDHPPTYSTNDADDENGVIPPPNNGNQNFGRRH